jgi:hypothetical protein
MRTPQKGLGTERLFAKLDELRGKLPVEYVIEPFRPDGSSPA